MNMELKDKNKQKKILKKITPRSLKNTIHYSIDGLVYFYRSEKSGILHLIATLIIVCGGIFFHIQYGEAFVLAILLTLILAIELLNSGIEAVCDLVSPQYHPLVKAAKDCGSAATFVLSVITSVITLIIFIPYMIEFMR